MPAQRQPPAGKASSPSKNRRKNARRDASTRAEEIVNTVKEETTDKIKTAKETKHKSKHDKPETHKFIIDTHNLGAWRFIYMAFVGIIAFATGTAIGLRTLLAIPEYSASIVAEKGAVKSSSIYIAVSLVLLAVSLILLLIFSFFLMESARWRQKLAVKSVLVSYPLGICNGLIFGHNICYAAGLTRSDCSGAVVGLLLLSYVIMILAKMLFLILKDVIGWEEIEV
ncbi:hypothetical protein AAP_00405 [Ascosphaera apis ARSEF 7405]|uniref:Uncharacterized protein n=1 Tax=Ascosphaera apis ARSEF 7405 TaxID=392613 RepID=A0A168DV25_9EURO|nr:hypothetical protein AAP_00405 [Ascosphaera apis ARSEF 7405]